MWNLRHGAEHGRAALRHSRGSTDLDRFLGSPTLLLFTPRRSFSSASRYSARPPWPRMSLNCAQQIRFRLELVLV